MPTLLPGNVQSAIEANLTLNPPPSHSLSPSLEAIFAHLEYKSSAMVGLVCAACIIWAASVYQIHVPLEKALRSPPP